MNNSVLFAQPVASVAQQLVGHRLLVDGCGGIIVETEAYHETEPAFHSHQREQRLSVLRSKPGTIYLYSLYGHTLINIVAENSGIGAGVLLRALEPTHGVETMRSRSSPSVSQHLIASGPGRLTRALQVEQSWHGQLIEDTPIIIEPGPPLPVVASSRIGITQGIDIPWRFSALDNHCVSRPRPW